MRGIRQGSSFDVAARGVQSRTGSCCPQCWTHAPDVVSSGRNS
ncbi:hypothetical protein FDF13_01845 [Brevibacterium sp. CS2]|nr:hypothetical protein FDF13_01845 [Brevibacterium sp. CS2]